MFEEAAGVNKYKLRRRLSLKKLDEVKRDLVRVSDIVAEVEKSVRSLQRQAKKADKYNQIQSVLREKELDLAERQFSNYTHTKNELDQKSILLNETKTHVDSEIRRIETSLIKLRDDVRSIEEKYSAKQLLVNKESEKLYEIQNKISVSEEREKSLNLNADRNNIELEELKIQLVDLDESLISTQELILEVEQKIVEKNYKLNSTTEEINNRKLNLNQKKPDLKLLEIKLILSIKK
jgi:chromosome segregation protein